MYKREFENLINTKKLPTALFLYGECEFQVNHYSQLVLQEWMDEEDEILTLYYDEYNYSWAKEHLGQSSLFGGNNIVTVKSDKVIPKKELDTLVALCNKSDNSYFLYQYFGDATKAKNISKSFTKKVGGDFVRFFKASVSEALTFLHHRAKELNLNIDGYALQHLYFLQAENLALCINELEKLTLLEGNISTASIDRVVYGLGTIGMEKFIEKLIANDNIKEAYLSLLESGNADEVRVINAIQNFLSTLLLFHMYIKTYGQYDARAILGYPLPPAIAKKRADVSIKIKISTYTKLLEHLAHTELSLKKSKNIDKNAYLLSSLIKLQSLL